MNTKFDIEVHFIYKIANMLIYKRLEILIHRKINIKANIQNS